MLPAHFHRDGRPLVLGHRGASAEAPENTLAAFSLALQQGADGIELDAQLCASGEVVVVHDASLARTTGFAAPVTHASWSVIRTLDAGSWKSGRFRGERIPLLLEVLESFPRLVNVELKCDLADDAGLTGEVVRVIRAAKAEDRVLLSSFNVACLWRARLLAPRMPRALLFESEQRWPLRSGLLAPLLGVAAMHPEHVLALPRRVSRWRRRGYTVGCWTVDDPYLAASLHQSGVEAVITNWPARILARWNV